MNNQIQEAREIAKDIKTKFHATAPLSYLEIQALAISEVLLQITGRAFIVVPREALKDMANEPDEHYRKQMYYDVLGQGRNEGNTKP